LVGGAFQPQFVAQRYHQENNGGFKLRGAVARNSLQLHVKLLRAPLVERVHSRATCAVAAADKHNRWPVLGLAHRSDLAGLLVHVPVRHDSTVSPVLPELHKLHSNPTGPMKADGTPDKRYKANRR